MTSFEVQDVTKADPHGASLEAGKVVAEAKSGQEKLEENKVHEKPGLLESGCIKQLLELGVAIVFEVLHMHALDFVATGSSTSVMLSSESGKILCTCRVEAQWSRRIKALARSTIVVRIWGLLGWGGSVSPARAYCLSEMEVTG
ncbi:hypothetical protein Ancab_038693 [Ancistrocladus abbreviatus]